MKREKTITIKLNPRLANDFQGWAGEEGNTSKQKIVEFITRYVKANNDRDLAYLEAKNNSPFFSKKFDRPE